MITMARIAGSPLIAYAIISDMKEIALGGCLLAALSDWLDGYLLHNNFCRTCLPFTPYSHSHSYTHFAYRIYSKKLQPKDCARRFFGSSC